MKLEVGKSYRTRDGKKVTISVNRDNNSISYPFAGDNNVDYTEDGRFWEHPTKDRQDIIAEWEDVPVILEAARAHLKLQGGE